MKDEKEISLTIPARPVDFERLNNLSKPKTKVEELKEPERKFDSKLT